MAVNTNKVTLPADDTLALVCTLPTSVKGSPQVTINLITASASVYIGGANIDNEGGNGFLLQAGTAAPWPSVTITGTGDIWAVGIAGGEVLTYLMSWVDG